MNQTPIQSDPLAVLDQLDPVAIRERLARVSREATALRRLLRLAEQSAKAVQDRKGRTEK